MKNPVISSIILFSTAFLFSCANSSDTTESAKSLPDQSNETTSQSEYRAGAEWRLIWADEFDGEELDSENWNRQVEPAGRFNDEWQRYTNSTENAYVENGAMVIKAIHVGEKHAIDQYTSARINSANKQTWKYGKIAARIKLPYGQGLWPAFWMLGANINENGGDTPWPQCGEIDILELYGNKDNGVVEANIHYADSTNKHTSMGAVAYHLDEGRFADDFHNFELEWNADSLKWSVDGNTYVTTPITGDEFTEFHEEFFILFNVAVGSKWAGRPDSSTVFPQYMYIDWVRVYEENRSE